MLKPLPRPTHKVYWEIGACPSCQKETQVRIGADKFANVVSRECGQCGRDLREE